MVAALHAAPMAVATESVFVTRSDRDDNDDSDIEVLWSHVGAPKRPHE